MAYDASSTGAIVRRIVDAGLYATLQPGAQGAGLTGPGGIYAYCSSNGSTVVGGSTGFFSACGAQPSSGAGQGVLARSPNNVGMRQGDLLVNVESSLGVTPGRVSWHSVIASTFNQASSGASSGFIASAGFDITVSSGTT